MTGPKWNKGILLKNTSILLTVLMVINACGTKNGQNSNPVTNIYYNTLGKLGGGTGGTGDGGGGQGVLCSSEAIDNRYKNRLFTRDIFEAMSNGLEMTEIPIGSSSTQSGLSDEAINTLTTSLKKYFGPASEKLEFTDKKIWKDLADRIKMTDQELKLTTDAKSFLEIPKGCDLVQIASWADSVGNDSAGTLYVKPELWNRLDELNRIALLAHEYFYKQARTAGFADSDFIRNKIGLLFAKEKGLKPLFEEWDPSTDQRFSETMPASKVGFKVCEGTSVEDATSTLLYYQYLGKDKLQHIVITKINSARISFSVFENAHFKFDPKSNWDLATVTDLMVLASGPDYKNSLQFDLWYGLAGIIRDDFFDPISSGSYDLENHLNGIELSFQKENERKRTAWTNIIKREKTAVQITIQDPLLTKYPDLNNMKFDEFYNLFQSLVIKKFDNLKDQTNLPYDNMVLTQSLKDLKFEIELKTEKSILKDELYNFSKWEKNFNELISPYLKFNNLRTLKAEKMQYDLLKRYPTFLLNLKLLLISSELKKEMYYEMIPQTNLGKIIGPGRLTLSDEHSTLNFELQCLNPTTYLRKKLFENNIKYYNSEDVFKLIEASKNTENIIKIQGLEISEKTKEFHEIMSDGDYSPSDIMTAKISPLIRNLAHGNFKFWGADWDMPGPADKNNDIGYMLVTDLLKEKKVSVYKCEDYLLPGLVYDLESYDTQTNSYIQNKECITLKFQPSNNKYILAYKSSEMELLKDIAYYKDRGRTPKLYYLKLLPDNKW